MSDPFGELRGTKRWVGWRYEQRTSDGKPTKVPYASDGRRAKSDDPTTWGTRGEADVWCKRSLNGRGGGIGIVLGDLNCGLHLCGLDLDSCIKDGTLAPWAANILQAARTYAERSPSGNGVKLFYLAACEDVRPFLDRIGVERHAWGCRRSIPGEDAKDHGPAVECYLAGRYFTVTADRWADAPDRLALLDSAQLGTLAKLIPPAKTSANNGTGTAGAGDTSRSAVAFGKGLKLYREGKTYEEMVSALHGDPETAEWAREKGDADGGRQFRRIWDKAKEDTNGKTDLRVVALKKGADVTMQKIDWLWRGWLARGKLHVLGGGKGAGKSTIGFDVLAQLTSGSGTWPDGTPVLVQGDVLVWSGEDDIDDTILPRMVVAGADRERIYFIDGVIIDGVKRAFDPATDMAALLETIQTLPDLLAILIDPIVSATAGDSHKNAETRRGLQPLVDLATARDIATIGITHFTKGTQGRDPIERITGSLAFGAIPRVVWGAAKGDNEDGPRRLVRIASNIGPMGGGFEYLLRQDLVPDHDFTAQRIAWGKKLEGSPLELLENKQDKLKKDQSDELLDRILASGPAAVADIKKAADANGVSWRTLERAKGDAKPAINAAQASTLREMGLLPKEGAERGWYWYREPVKTTWQAA